MSKHIVNSEIALQSFIGTLRELWTSRRYLEVSVKEGRTRSVDQNAISHAWYGQIARELREDDELGWKCYCKLHHGVPILRAEDDDFRGSYDAAIKGLTYEQKLKVMRLLPVSSLMTKAQLSKYLEAVQADFVGRGVMLSFPEAA